MLQQPDSSCRSSLLACLDLLHCTNSHARDILPCNNPEHTIQTCLTNIPFAACHPVHDFAAFHPHLFHPPAPTQLRKTFPLKTLHDTRIYSFARSAAAAAAAAAASRSAPGSPASSAAGDPSGGQSTGRAQQQQQQRGDPQQQQVLELQCASHHNTPEHRGQYVLPDLEAACFLVSLALQLMRWGAVCVTGVGWLL